MDNITITTEEYKRLLATSIKVEIFADFVNRSRYSISREDCGMYLGFKIEDKED